MNRKAFSRFLFLANEVVDEHLSHAVCSVHCIGIGVCCPFRVPYAIQMVCRPSFQTTERLEPHEIKEQVKDQISQFATGSMDCVDRAKEAARKVEKLPMLAQQGVALREIREALDPTAYIATNLSAIIDGHPKYRIGELTPWRLEKPSSRNA